MSLSNGEFQKRFRKISEASGGSEIGSSYDDGLVVISRYGEFACKVVDGGMLLSFFPDKGFLCGYAAEGDLAFVAFDVASLFANLEEDEISQLAHGGEDVADLMAILRENGEIMFLTVFPQIGSVRIKVMRGGQIRGEEVVENIDMAAGRLGKIYLDEATIAYNVASNGDELVVGIGETSPTLATMRSVSLSHRVDFPQNLNELGSKGLRKLAEQIVLND